MIAFITRLTPRTGEVADFHNRKYQVFRRMQDDYQAYAAIMAGANTTGTH